MAAKAKRATSKAADSIAPRPTFPRLSSSRFGSGPALSVVAIAMAISAAEPKRRSLGEVVQAWTVLDCGIELDY
jgi:hypothetical protein